MSSREEFLRSLGITKEDMVNPEEEAAPAPPARQGSRGGSSLVINRQREDPHITSSSSSSAFKSSAGMKNASPAGSSGLYGNKQSSASYGSASAYEDQSQSSSSQRSSSRPTAMASLSATGSHEIPAAEAKYTHSYDSYSSATAPANKPSTPRKTRAELAKEAEEMKIEGNQAFQRQEYRKAIRCYSKAIEADPTNAALYSNRSAAYLAGGSQTGMDTRSLALRDAVKATELRPDWPKGYCRQGEALIELERFIEAKEAYEQAVSLDPASETFRQRVAECEAKVGPVRSTPSAINSGTPMDRSSSTRDMLDSMSKRESARELQAKYAHQAGGDSFQGNNFKEQELERLRQRRSNSSFNASMNSDSGSGSSSMPAGVTGVAGVGTNGYFSAARSVPQEYSSHAAKAYQQSLLEAYRKKKSQH